MSRKGGTGGGTCRVQTAWSCLCSAVEMAWFALGGVFLSFLAYMDLENKLSYLVGA